MKWHRPLAAITTHLTTCMPARSAVNGECVGVGLGLTVICGLGPAGFHCADRTSYSSAGLLLLAVADELEHEARVDNTTENNN